MTTEVSVAAVMAVMAIFYRRHWEVPYSTGLTDSHFRQMCESLHWFVRNIIYYAKRLVRANRDYNNRLINRKCRITSLSLQGPNDYLGDRKIGSVIDWCDHGRVHPPTLPWSHQPISWSWIMDDSHLSRSMPIGRPIPAIKLFQTLTLRLQGQDHGCGLRARSYSQPSILTRILFISHQSGPTIPEIQLFRNLTLKYPRSRSWVRQKFKVTHYTKYPTNALPFHFTSIGPTLPEIWPK